MIKRIVTDPQKSDMGSGFGEFQFDNSPTLKDLLDFIRENAETWGTITIIYPSGEILRLFDYDLWSKNARRFYYNLSWELKFKVKEAKFSYCFMNEDITIKLER